MLEILHQRSKNSGLIAGDLQKGYYGEVLSSDFISGSALATAIGLTAGAQITENNAVNWFKFAYGGKTLYIPKKAFRNSISWNMIYNVGAVYGDDTNGLRNSGTNRLQDARVTIKGKTYRVRLMRVSNADPGTIVGNRELRDLFFNILASNDGGTGAWANNSFKDIGVDYNTDLGGYTLGMEDNDGARSYSFSTYSLPNLWPINRAALTASTGWRPVLELMS